MHITLGLYSNENHFSDRKPPLNNKQEMKFGIRVRVRPSPTPPVRIPDFVTEAKTMPVKTTLQPEIRTVFSQSPSTEKLTTTTTTRKPVTTSKIPTTRRTTTTTTTTTPSPLFPDPWGLLKVSGKLGISIMLHTIEEIPQERANFH